jgi:asparagine synthase (glutamine-hydrolysing)
MCGISIVINKVGQRVPQELVKSLNDKVSHRGPDDEGFYVGSDFAFGHRRLSIIDLTAGGHQPMERKQLCITYNGEIYNYLELREELIALGHSFSSASDTEVILAAYEQWGTNAFEKLNGMWAFAISNSVTNEIIFSRDHFGIKPLYYTQTDHFFLAGSEIKQFTACHEFQTVLNQSVAVNFLVSGLLNYSNQTFFEGVNELRPGHYLRYNLATHNIELQPWYFLDRASVPVQDNFDMAVKKVRSLFEDSVRIRMRSDVRVGSCLSGGIDSSAIVGIIHGKAMANEKFATITSCYTDKRYDEQQFSDLVTVQTGFRSNKVYPDLNHLLEEGHLDEMIYHQDQPFGSASHYSEYSVFKEARKSGIIVMQDGQGSDEYLCGYSEFWIAHLLEMMKSFQWRNAFALLKQKATHRGTTFFTELKSVLRSVFLFKLANRWNKWMGKANEPWLSGDWQHLAATSLVKFKRQSVRDLSITEIERSSIPYQLHSEDRNSMLFSIESRLPFLDHRLVEYCIGLPTSYKIRNGYTKAVLREAVTELPEVIKKRKDKMGFVAPDGQWMQLNKFAVRQELKDVIASTGIFSNELLNYFDLFTEGNRAYELIYFRALTFGRFCKIFKIKIK